MKVSILTFHGSHNYGAMLQAFAIQKAVEKKVDNVEIINYRTQENIETYKVFKKVNSLKSGIKFLFTLKNYKELMKGYKNFEGFINNFMYTTKPYSTNFDLLNAQLDTDLIIVGSDQVWNWDSKLDLTYLLDFADNHIKKTSYAASMGDSILNEEKAKIVIPILENFNYITVREEWAKNQLGKHGIKSRRVLDPVFLLNKTEWENYSTPRRINEKYIILYVLGKSSQINNIIDKVNAEKKYKVVLITDEPYKNINCDYCFRDSGPQEFLSLIEYAECVLTTSFHGTALSLIYGKEFYTVSRNRKSVRILDLLKDLDIEHRYIDTVDDIHLDRKIDYYTTSNKLKTMIDESYLILDELLNVGDYE